MEKQIIQKVIVDLQLWPNIGLEKNPTYPLCYVRQQYFAVVIVSEFLVTMDISYRENLLAIFVMFLCLEAIICFKLIYFNLKAQSFLHMLFLVNMILQVCIKYGPMQISKHLML